MQTTSSVDASLQHFPCTMQTQQSSCQRRQGVSRSQYGTSPMHIARKVAMTPRYTTTIVPATAHPEG